jgi:hypothetical protein
MPRGRILGCGIDPFTRHLSTFSKPVVHLLDWQRSAEFIYCDSYTRRADQRRSLSHSAHISSNHSCRWNGHPLWLQSFAGGGQCLQSLAVQADLLVGQPAA